MVSKVQPQKRKVNDVRREDSLEKDTAQEEERIEETQPKKKDDMESVSQPVFQDDIPFWGPGTQPPPEDSFWKKLNNSRK